MHTNCCCVGSVEWTESVGDGDTNRGWDEVLQRFSYTSKKLQGVQVQHWIQHCSNNARFSYKVFESSGVHRKFSWRGLHSVAYGGHLYWCALFVTSQFDVIFMFPNERFREFSWHNIHILLHALTLIYVSLHWIWIISAPGYDIGRRSTQRYDTAVHNCKNIRLHLIEYKQSSIEGVPLDWLAHTPVCKIESC